MAMEKVFGRHRAEVKTLAGVYGAAYEGDEGFAAIQKSVEDFAADEGRRPRMLVVKMGQDGHDRGAKVIATAFADIGFDVDVGPLFQTPAEAVRQAIENGPAPKAVGQGAEHQKQQRHDPEIARKRPADGCVIRGQIRRHAGQGRHEHVEAERPHGRHADEGRDMGARPAHPRDRALGSDRLTSRGSGRAA